MSRRLDHERAKQAARGRASAAERASARRRDMTLRQELYLGHLLEENPAAAQLVAAYFRRRGEPAFQVFCVGRETASVLIRWLKGGGAPDAFPLLDD